MNENVIQLSGRDAVRPRSTGGDDGGSGLEARVAKMEAGVQHLERDVGELRADMRDVRDRLTRLEERVSHLPGKGFIVTSLLLTLAVVAGLIAFQEQIQLLVRQPGPLSESRP